MEHEELCYERCYRCRAAVPNGLVQRRTMKIGYSTGTRASTHYAQVSLCGVCDQEVRLEEQEESAANLRYVGVFCGMVALTFAGVIWPIGLGVMMLLARYRMVGRSLLALVVVAVFYFKTTSYPNQIWTYFVLPWAVTTGVLVLWKVGGKLSGRGLQGKRPLALERRAS